METKILDSNTFKRILIGGVNGIRSQIQTINELNVFPVPDGDTGTNMAKTIESGVAKISDSSKESVGDMASDFARGSVLGARGNSGVILSQFFAGIGDALKDKQTVTPRELAEASMEGVKRAYSAVANPVEGTMLTVFRESAEYVINKITDDSSLEELLRLSIEKGKSSLEKTKEMLPALAEADVVDSGGAGCLSIAIGMYETLLGKVSESTSFIPNEAVIASEKINYDLFTTDTKLEFGYCTECLVRLQRAKGEPECFDKEAFTKELENYGCNSIVILRDGDILKLHAHTMTPGNILTMCQRFGEFLNVKIENMCLQHSEKTEGMKKNKKKKPPKPYGVAAVCTGDGMKALFEQLGADVIIDGGQTGNPSAEDFINAFSSINAENIIVLPNNGNIVMTANQAKDLWEGNNVTVIPTKTLSEGYSALAVFNSAAGSLEEQISGMTSAAESVISGEITVAIRDALIGGVCVKEGEFIGILSGELVTSKPKADEALCDMISKIEDIEDKEILTLFIGAGVSDDERVMVTEVIEERFENLSLEVFIGGQEVYKYLIAVE